MTIDSAKRGEAGAAGSRILSDISDLSSRSAGRRPPPAIRQTGNASRREAAAKLLQRLPVVHIPMAQHIGAEDRGKRRVDKGQRIDRTAAHRARALSAGAGAGTLIGVETDNHARLDGGGELCQ